MSATVAAALKKIAVALLTDKKALKTIGGIVLGVLIIIIMPIVAVVSLFNGGIEIDTDRLQTMVVENLSAEEQAKLQAVEDTMYAIEDAMLAAGFPARVKEAQVLYVLALSDFADDNGFVEKLVGCFTAEQTDAQLISAVNSAFGTSLAPEDFTQVMQRSGLCISTPLTIRIPRPRTIWIWSSGPSPLKKPDGAMCGAPLERC